MRTNGKNDLDLTSLNNTNKKTANATNQPVWIMMCRLRLLLLPNDRSQYLHANDFLLFASNRGTISSIGFECSLTAIAAAAALAADAVATLTALHELHFDECRLIVGFRLHTKHFMVVPLLAWTFRCFRKSLCSRNRRLQSSQENGFSPVWTEDDEGKCGKSKCDLRQCGLYAMKMIERNQNENGNLLIWWRFKL